MSALTLIKMLLELERKNSTDETIQISPYFSSVSLLIENKNEQFYELTAPTETKIDLIDLTLVLRMLAASSDEYGPFSNAKYEDGKIKIPVNPVDTFNISSQKALPNKFLTCDLSKTILTCDDVIKIYRDDTFTINIQHEIHFFITNYIHDDNKKVAKKNAQLLMLGALEYKNDFINFLNDPQFSVATLYAVFKEFSKESQERIIKTLYTLTISSNNATLKINSSFICQFLIAHYKNRGDLHMTTQILLIANLNQCDIPRDPDNEILIKIARLTTFNIDSQDANFFSSLKTNDTFFQMSLNMIMKNSHGFSSASYLRLKAILQNENTGLSRMMGSNHCITLKNMLKNYVKLRPELSHKDKVALYYMMQPYMENNQLCRTKLKTERPLAASLREFYNNLRRDVIDSKAIELYKNVHGANSVSQVLQMSAVDAQASTTNNNNNTYSLSAFSAK
jgi:hypothetical protein